MPPTGRVNEVADVLPVTQASEVRAPQVPENNCMTGVAAFRLAPRLEMVIVGHGLVAVNMYQMSAEFALPQLPGTPEVGVMPFIFPPERVQLVPTVNEEETLVQRSTPCARPFFDSRKVVLQTMRTFTVRVRIKEVFMDRIIGFRGLSPGYRSRLD